MGGAIVFEDLKIPNYTTKVVTQLLTFIYWLSIDTRL